MKQLMFIQVAFHFIVFHTFSAIQSMMYVFWKTKSQQICRFVDFIYCLTQICTIRHIHPLKIFLHSILCNLKITIRNIRTNTSLSFLGLQCKTSKTAFKKKKWDECNSLYFKMQELGRKERHQTRAECGLTKILFA